MASKINLLIINCRDFNFPHAGNCDVRLMRVKHSVRVKVITYLPKRISKRTEFYISHTENFMWDSITNNGVKLIYAELLDRLNYTDLFISHYGYSDGDVAGAYENDVEYLSWLTDTLFSFNADKKPFEFPVEPIADAMRGVSEAMTHGVDAMIMAGRTVGKSAHLFKDFGIDKAVGVDKGVVTTVRGGVEASKELKVSPLAKGLVNVRGVYVEPDSPEAKKYFGR